jgi:hypothetical protein
VGSWIEDGCVCERERERFVVAWSLKGEIGEEEYREGGVDRVG